MSKKIVTITIIIILLLIISIAIVLLSPDFQGARKINYINNLESYNINEKGVLNNQLWTERYAGDVTANVVNKSVNYFATTLLPEYKNVINVTEYYNANKKNIKRFLGIDDEDSFAKIVQQAKKISSNELDNLKILDGTVELSSNGVLATIGIYYKDGVKLYFNIEISNSIVEGMTSVAYSANVDESKIIERVDSTSKENESVNGTGRIR